MVAQQIISRSADETQEIGRQLGTTLTGGEVVLLTGSLGTGKSVFARGIADALQIRDWRGSPTFTLVNEYAGARHLYHVDLYRLTEPEIEDLGFDEYARLDSIMVVEWADRAPDYLAGLAHGVIIWVEIAFLGQGDERSIAVRRVTAPAAEKWADPA